MVIGYGQVTRTYKSLRPDKSMCRGCYCDFYNGNNPMGIKECWHFKDTEVADKLFYPGSWATDSQMVLVKKTLRCYRGT